MHKKRLENLICQGLQSRAGKHRVQINIMDITKACDYAQDLVLNAKLDVEAACDHAFTKYWQPIENLNQVN